MKETHRHIKYNPQKISAGSSHELVASNSIQKKYILSIGSADAVILHPSFLCPALKQLGKELHLFMLVDARFYNTYESAEGKQDKKAGPAVSGAVNRFLKIVDWDSIDKTCHAAEPLFSNDEAKQNIEVHYLWCTNELQNELMLDKEGKPFAQIHPEVFKLYQSKGLYWGFQIIIKNLPNDNPGLYDISWVGYKQAESEDKKGYFFELQDECITDYNKTYRSQYHPLSCNVDSDDHPVFEEVETEIQSYHPLYISDKPCLDIGHMSDVHVSARQHLFTQSKAKLIEGENGSDEIGSMVNTSYATLKNLMKQMGDEIDLLIFTGDLIDYNRNYNPDNEIDKSEETRKSSEIWKALNLDNLTDKKRYPVGIDNLVIYELFRWYYRDKKKPIMLISGNHEAYTLPYGISPRVKIWRSFNSSYNLFHKITVDETIAKSIKQAQEDADKIRKEEEAKKGPDIYDNRANEGIPADHNLTITEAILMYGPDYARVVMSASYDFGGERNFRPENMDWFYHAFTPLTSFHTSYGEQCFIGLGWGNDERFVGHIPKVQGEFKAGGFLPRSTQGISETQLKIIDQALEQGKTNNLMLSHFTFANYTATRPITEPGKVAFDSSHTVYDYGTFEKNRPKVYPIIKDRIQYTLSGHSHRCGLYQFGEKIKPANPRAVSRSWKVTGQAPKDGKYQPTSGCRMLVAASGGPIPVQNYNHELFNMGLDRPSGNYIKFNGSNEAEIGIKVATNKNSKPRLAVALDYADLFLKDEKKPGVFTQFESEKNKHPFTVQLADEIKLNAEGFIGSKVLLVVFSSDGKRIVLSGDAIEFQKEKRQFSVKIADEGFDEQLNDAADKYHMGFLDITLKSDEDKSLENYDAEKRWIFPIELISRQKQAKDDYEENMNKAKSYGSYQVSDKMIDDGKKSIEEKVHGYLIRRHRLYGEIPDFRFYRLIKADEYK